MRNMFMSAKVAERVAEVDAIFVEHRNFRRAFRTIGRSIETCGLREEPMGTQVQGHPGVGKTTLRKKLAQAFAMVVDGSTIVEPPLPDMVADEQILVQLDMPVDPSQRNVLIAILVAMKDPKPNEKDTEILRDRVIVFIKRCRTRGLLFDEAQRLVDGRGEVRAQDALDVLKTITDRTGVSITLIGVGSLSQALNVDGQIRRRWGNPIIFVPYTWPEFDAVPVTDPSFRFTADQTEMVGVFTAMERLLPIPMHPEASILNPDPVIAYVNARRFYYSCRGLVGMHKKLLLSTMEESEDFDEVTLQLLSLGFQKAFIEETGMVDPFGPDWHGQSPPPLLDDTIPKYRKRKRRPSKKQRQAELADALTK